MSWVLRYDVLRAGEAHMQPRFSEISPWFPHSHQGRHSQFTSCWLGSFCLLFLGHVLCFLCPNSHPQFVSLWPSVGIFHVFHLFHLLPSLFLNHPGLHPTTLPSTSLGYLNSYQEEQEVALPPSPSFQKASFDQL